MIYLGTSSSPAINAAMRDGLLGRVCTPAGGRKQKDGVWCLDNGAFSDNYDPDAWWEYVVANAADADTCLFVALPDVVGDWPGTLASSLPWLPRVRALGYRAALVLQDGATPDTVPWQDLDAVFVGGSTEWKLGPAVPPLVRAAKLRGLWVHMGRVNSLKRLAYAAHLGCDSVDGTYLAFGPDRNLDRLTRWLRRIDTQGVLFTDATEQGPVRTSP